MNNILQKWGLFTYLRRINTSKVVVNGMEIAPTKTSATAKIASKMFEFFCNSLLCFTAMITKMFSSIVKGQAMDVVVTVV